MLAVGESVNLFFSHVRESSFISRSVIEIMMLMLWEGGWEWTTLTISSEIWSFSFSFIPTPYIYILLLPPSGGVLEHYLLLLLRCISFLRLARDRPLLGVQFLQHFSKTAFRNAQFLQWQMKSAFLGSHFLQSF